MGGNTSREIHVDGTIQPGYETVKDMFENNLRTGRENKAQLCVYVRGEKVVDLWGCADKDPKYNADSTTIVFSSTKSLTAIAMAILVDKGLLSYDAKIADYWPEFAQNNKGALTVADLMRHEAGLAAFNHTFNLEDILPHNIKNNSIGSVIEKEECVFRQDKEKPGQYHAITRGWIANEIFRRVHPEGRTIGEFLRTDILDPLGGARAFIGLKEDELKNSQDSEIMKNSFVLGESLKMKSRGRKIECSFADMCKLIMMSMKYKDDERQGVPPFMAGMKDNNDMDGVAAMFNSPITKQGEMPSANGQCSARGLAIIGAVMANRGKLNGTEIISETGWEALHANPIKRNMFLNILTNFTQGGVNLGVTQVPPDPRSGLRPHLGVEGFYGWHGMGGSLFQWHPRKQIGFAYVPTFLNFVDFENNLAVYLQEEVVNCVNNVHSEDRK